MQGIKRRAWIEVDMYRLRENVEALKALVPQSCRLMPAVKGDAYGLGAAEISRALSHAGIGSFCVASLGEGIQLRESGVQGEILVLGYTHPDCAAELKEYGLMQTVVDLDHAAALAGAGCPLPVHIKIDTGMHRLGERAERMDAIKSTAAMEGLSVKGVFTQLARCGSRSPADIAFTKKQIATFWQVAAAVRSTGARPAPHAQCSYGILNYPGRQYAYARPGLAVYGIVDEGQCLRKAPPLKPVFEVKCRVALVKDVFAGESVGYDGAFTATQNMRAAVITAGYADGLPRCLSGGVGKVLVNGQFAAVLGNICMDQAMVDVTGIPGVKQGDVVTLIGRDGAGAISVHEFARWAGTIPNEVMSRLGGRMERCYSAPQHGSLSVSSACR